VNKSYWFVLLVLLCGDIGNQIIIHRQQKLIREYQSTLRRAIAVANSCIGSQSRVGYSTADVVPRQRR